MGPFDGQSHGFKEKSQSWFSVEKCSFLWWISQLCFFFTGGYTNGIYNNNYQSYQIQWICAWRFLELISPISWGQKPHPADADCLIYFFRRFSQLKFSQPPTRQQTPAYYPYLVGGLVAIFYFPISIGLLIIPIDGLIFFRGVAKNHQPDISLGCFFLPMFFFWGPIVWCVQRQGMNPPSDESLMSRGHDFWWRLGDVSIEGNHPSHMAEEWGNVFSLYWDNQC